MTGPIVLSGAGFIHALVNSGNSRMLHRNAADALEAGSGISPPARKFAPSASDSARRGAHAGLSAPVSVVKGIFLGFLSFAVFSCGDACIKALGGRLTVFEIGFFATLVAFIAV